MTPAVGQLVRVVINGCEVWRGRVLAIRGRWAVVAEGRRRDEAQLAHLEPLGVA